VFNPLISWRVSQRGQFENYQTANLTKVFAQISTKLKGVGRYNGRDYRLSR
jgi:hypothetical protein